MAAIKNVSVESLPRLERFAAASIGRIFNHHISVEQLSIPRSKSETFETHPDSTDLINLHAVCAGDPHDPLVVLLHGFPENWYTWRFMIPFLVHHGYRVIAPDLRGVNLSDKPSNKSDYALDALANDVTNIILSQNKHHTGKAQAVIGHDFGSTIMYRFAQQRPDLVKSIVSLDGSHASPLMTSMYDTLNFGQIGKLYPWLSMILPHTPYRWLLKHMPRVVTRYGYSKKTEGGELEYWRNELYNPEYNNEDFRTIKYAPLPMDWGFDSYLTQKASKELDPGSHHLLSHQDQIRYSPPNLARVWARFATNFQAESWLHQNSIDYQSKQLEQFFETECPSSFPYLWLYSLPLANLGKTWDSYKNGKHLELDNSSLALDSLSKPIQDRIPNPKPIGIPSLALWGEESRYTPDTQIDHYNYLTNHTHKIIPKSRHFVHWDTGKEVQNEILKFFHQ